MAKIFYAVIALKNSEVAAVAKELEVRKMEPIANWLRANKDLLYGAGREDWKPFMDDESIRDFLEAEPKVYKSATSLIEKIDDDASDISVLLDQSVDLYVIDVFALFLKKYTNLAGKLDFAFAQTKTKCCLIIPYRISKDFHAIHDSLVDSYVKLWNTVYKAYKMGSLSRTVLGPDDLRNFRQYLVSQYPDDQPNPATMQQVNKVLGEPTRTQVPRIGT
jgi:hypothetical protein